MKKIDISIILGIGIIIFIIEFLLKNFLTNETRLMYFFASIIGGILILAGITILAIRINPKISRKQNQTILVKLYDFITYLRHFFLFQFFGSLYHFRLEKKFRTLDSDKKKEKIKEKIIKEKDGNFLELLVFLDVLFGLTIVGLNSGFKILQGIINCLIIYAIVRIADIIVYQMYAIKVSTPATVKSPYRLISLIFVNYLEVIIWFAFFYQVIGISHSISGSLYYSVSNMVLLGDNSISTGSMITKLVISVQILLGIFIIVIAIARFVPLLEKSKYTKLGSAQFMDFKKFSNKQKLLYGGIWLIVLMIAVLISWIPDSFHIPL